MELLLVTGMSGAGKTQTIHALEDIGFFCIDNIPPELIERFFELCMRSDGEGRYAAVVDVRSHAAFGELPQMKKRLGEAGYPLKILFLDAADEMLIRRYKETRRRHPLMDEHDCRAVPQAIARERELLAVLRAAADVVLDTSQTGTAKHRERIVSLFSGASDGGMTVSVMSFGFKYGLPADADLVFDVRCLPNPYYIESLRPLTGQDERVSGYVFGFAQSGELLRRILELIDYSLPLYRQEGKSHLVVTVGCTGGQHRSVAFAEEIGRFLQRGGITATIIHRDSTR